MEKSLAAMQTALRVLTAVTREESPAQSDLDELRKFSPLMQDGPADELACDVIQQAIRRREQVRRAR